MVFVKNIEQRDLCIHARTLANVRHNAIGVTMSDFHDARFSSPAVFRNRLSILKVLQPMLPSAGLVVEVASGSGEHVVFLADRLPALDWQPSDPSPAARASIAAWTAADRVINVRLPLDLDASRTPWPVAAADAILAINMVHISPWSATLGLLREAARLLPSGGLLYLYGPFIEAGKMLAPSNAAFDADLRDRNVAWGLRDLAAVEAAAVRSGLKVQTVLPMPANNLSVIVRRT